MTGDEKLQELIETLERVTKGKKPTREQRWFVKQATAYLRGEFDTIDEALGLPTNNVTLHELLGLDPGDDPS